jgi:hypothetical protein
MSPNIPVDTSIHEELGQYGNRDETWNDVIARLLKHVDEEKALADRDNRNTTYDRQEPKSISRGLDGLLEDGTVLRHKYKRGDYSGEIIEATVKDGRIDVEGDEGPYADVNTRSPSGAARESDKIVRGDDARGSGYNGWDWWEYKDENDNWVEIRELTQKS